MDGNNTLLHRFNARYAKALRALLIALMMLLIIPVFLQVVSRFISFVPRYIWTEEIARFAFVWIIMLGATIAVREGTHFDVDMLPQMSLTWTRSLRLLLLILMLLFAIVFLIGGYDFARFGAPQHSEIAGLPMLTIFIAWPLAGLSWVLFIVEQLYDHFDHKKLS